MNVQRKIQGGFTLIELMIVIAIVGILAAIALPAYQDYTVRAKVSEALANLAEAKTTIAEFYSANNRLPDSATIAGINTDPNTDIVASILYTSNAREPLLEAVIKQAILPNGVSDYYFQLSGYTASGNRIIWTCMPTSATGAISGGTTEMLEKYLPANCRG